MTQPDATQADVEKLCQEAIDYGFYSVCVNSANVGIARRVSVQQVNHMVVVLE